ncbi:coilin isoform X2 [Fagus crenata]
MESEGVRVRLEFKQRHVLKKSQLKEGLKRSWLLLKPEIETISDLAAHLLHNFDLHDSCPHGLILFMDGFVLPPFESTCILKDKDIVCVKRKGDTVVDVIEAGDGVDSIVVVDKNVEEQHVVTGLKLLANEDFEKEYDGCDDGGHEIAVSKKRKASEKLRSPKRKKNKVAATSKCLVVPEDDQHDVNAEDNGSLHHSRVLPKKSVKKDKSTKSVKKDKSSKSVKKDKSSALESNDTTKSATIAKRSCQLEENGKESVNVSQKPGETKKLPSRSARRKKAKRQWLRGQVKAESKKGQILKKDDEQSPVKENQKVSEEHQQSDEDSDEEGDVVPIVIRPGHIRFERPVDADRSIQQNQSPMEDSQWNGITCKKKGQKWGIEQKSSYKRNDHMNWNQESYRRNDHMNWNQESYKSTDHMNWNQESSDIHTAEKKTPATNPIDFNKLTPYTSMPKEGDVIAYRLIELSSSWTPEISSFRVGKISRYYPESKRIILVTLPEYPIEFEEIAEEIAAQPAASLYGEDGSLKIDYSSLVDVRIVKHGNLDSAKVVVSVVNEDPVDNQIAVSGFGVSNNNKETPAPTRENGEVNVWDEISQALNTKKAQLSQEDGWSKEESSGKNKWSYRALRGSALGPTMALLRAQNGL